MNPIAEARAHLRKADEFHLEAQGAFERGNYNVTTSNAVSAGINAKDAMCLALTGTTQKTDRHGDAVAELRKAGPIGAELATALDRLLRPKTKAQYQSASMSRADAESALRQASKLLVGARQAVPKT